MAKDKTEYVEGDHTPKDFSTETEAKQAVHDAKTELTEAIRGSHQILMTSSTVFPLTLFPDTITIDRQKITISKRSFFRIAEIMSMRVDDLLHVTINVGPLFGSLVIHHRMFSPGKPFVIRYLWREDAMKLKRILQGFVIATQNEIDTKPLQSSELALMLDKLGKDDHPE